MIEIFISPENLGLVWNADGMIYKLILFSSYSCSYFIVMILDWLMLRQNYRIVGNLIGSLSKYPRQNSFNGLPLCLQPEEVSLLKEKNLAKLVSCPLLSSRPPDSLFDAFEKEEKVFNEAQVFHFFEKYFCLYISL